MGFFSRRRTRTRTSPRKVRAGAALPPSRDARARSAWNGIEQDRSPELLREVFSALSTCGIIGVCPPTSPSVRDILSKSTRRLPSGCDQPRRRPGRGALLFGDISGLRRYRCH